jgi:transcriptional regulator with XRE-family HTH domain
MTSTLQGPDSTVRIEVLGEELRKLRARSGMTLSQVVQRIGISESHLSRMEMGKRAPSPEDLSALLVIYGVTGNERLELLTLAKKCSQPGLWHQGTYESRYATLKLLESRATAIVTFESLLIPGLLQTLPYAQAIFREVDMSDDQAVVEARAIGRVDRQAALRKLDCPKLTAIVTEAALRSVIGGRHVMRDQLTYLVEAAERPNVTFLVVPTAVGGHPGLEGSFVRLRFADRPSVVYMPNRHSSLYLEDPVEVAAYDSIIGKLKSLAMSEENSARLVSEMAASLG